MGITDLVNVAMALSQITTYGLALGMRNLWSESRSRGKRGCRGVSREEAEQLGHMQNAHAPGP